MINGQYQTVYEEKQITLKAAVFSTSLKLMMQVKEKQLKISIYEKQIQSLRQFGFLEKLCQNFDQIIQILNKVDHQFFQMKVQKGVIKILQKHLTKKDKIVGETKITFNLLRVEEKDVFENALEMIYQKCNSKSQLNYDQIKEMFNMIGVALEQLIKNKNNLSQKIKRNQQETVQRVTQLREQIEKQVKKQELSNEKNQQNFNELTELMKSQKESASDHFEVYKASMLEHNQYKQQICKQLKLLGENISNTVQKSINEKIQQIRNEFWSQINELREITSKQINNLKQQVIQLKNQKVDRKQFDVKMQQIAKICEQKQRIEKMQRKYKKKLENSLTQDWVDPQSYHFQGLSIHKNIITANKSSFIFGKTAILGQCVFSIKIDEIIEGNFIDIGIADIKYKSQYKLVGLPNRVFYRSTGSYWIGGSKKVQKIKSIKSGEILTVTIQMYKQIIKWNVGSEVLYSAKPTILSDKTITWVPFIYLKQKNYIQLVEFNPRVRSSIQLVEQL